MLFISLEAPLPPLLRLPPLILTVLMKIQSKRSTAGVFCVLSFAILSFPYTKQSIFQSVTLLLFRYLPYPWLLSWVHQNSFFCVRVSHARACVSVLTTGCVLFFSLRFKFGIFNWNDSIHRIGCRFLYTSNRIYAYCAFTLTMLTMGFFSLLHFFFVHLYI